MPSFHSIRAPWVLHRAERQKYEVRSTKTVRLRTSDFVLLLVLGLAIPLAASAQPPPPSPPLASGSSSFTIFLRGAPIGSEQIALTRTANGWSIVSSGRIGAPIDALARRVEVRYTPEWRPIEMSLDATIRGQVQTL